MKKKERACIDWPRETDDVKEIEYEKSIKLLDFYYGL